MRWRFGHWEDDDDDDDKITHDVNDNYDIADDQNTIRPIKTQRRRHDDYIASMTITMTEMITATIYDDLMMMIWKKVEETKSLWSFWVLQSFLDFLFTHEAFVETDNFYDTSF